jgi:hypothetical protein
MNKTPKMTIKIIPLGFFMFISPILILLYMSA